jgi:DNA-binding response OmpR family regulator
VEDDADFRNLVQLILEEGNPGLEVLHAESGRAALEVLRAAPVDVVILDLMLPDMHGWEVYLALRNGERNTQVPVIILSSQGTRHDRSFGLQVAQVHDYLTKPCLPSRLRASVATALARPI